MRNCKTCKYWKSIKQHNKDIKRFLSLIEEQDNKTAREMLKDCIEKVKEESKFNVDSFVDIVKNKEKLQ